MTHDTPMLGPYQLNTIVTGDARELAKAVPDDSVDLVFTDPLYWQIEDYEWLAQTAARVLRPGGELLVYYGQYYFYETVTALGKHLNVKWPLSEKKVNGSSRIWVYQLSSEVKPLLWCTKGERPRERKMHRIDFSYGNQDGGGVNHKWHKGTAKVAKWLSHFSKVGDLVWEPFCGGGSVPAACTQLDRNYLAFEIDPDTAQDARDRVANTQPPLPLPTVTQEALL